MHRFIPAVSIAALLLLFSAAQSAAQKPPAEVVMQKVAAKLDKVKVLGYTYTREFNYPSEDYLSKATAIGYLDMKSPDGAQGFKFHFTDDDYIAVYNGSESFVAVKKKKILVVTNNPERNRLESSSSLYNSPLTLKYALPKIIADKKISKKLSAEIGDGRRRYVVEFSLRKASLSGLGEIRELRDDRVTTYRVSIDARTFLPLEVLMTNDQNKDFTKTTFANITERPKPPVDSSWYFSSYTNEYKLEQPENKKLLEVGKSSPEFALREFASNSQVSLEKYKGKVVVLEFWIVHCGFCIAAVPKLNDIAKTFKDSDVELISINLHDEDKAIASFKTRHSPVYSILTEGESTADKYGVGAYPAMFVLGKDGKIAYSSLGLFEKDLETAIRASLEK